MNQETLALVLRDIAIALIQSGTTPDQVRREIPLFAKTLNKAIKKT